MFITQFNNEINNAIKEEFEFEVVYAYYSGLVDKVYCINKLHLHDVDDFYKVLERYGIKDGSSKM